MSWRPETTTEADAHGLWCMAARWFMQLVMESDAEMLYTI